MNRTMSVGNKYLEKNKKKINNIYVKQNLALFMN
jgi:hypothetical protein